MDELASARPITGEIWYMTTERDLSAAAVANLQALWAGVNTGKRLIVLGAGMDLHALTSLDAAWAEAEAALPDGWELSCVDRWGDRWTSPMVRASRLTPTPVARCSAPLLPPPFAPSRQSCGRLDESAYHAPN